ncbi:putative phage baseplate assembly protein [Halospina denitrificans]|uniref:Putative phage baseplate assembly protein n=1 Tax=Halospina denitrificans TaxID=332522 RepID=A0A4R7JUK8_9GAMM|nr:putative baseplate assembly protein [Halospina denitrificans]TDT41755.1 putative phage baseplate assembly protein [Halospina denitrificans]
MSLQAPKLDDRSFHDLVAEARRMVRERCPEWTDMSAGEPGTTLIELYAFLTEVMLYRINRLPEKAYIEFLRLMGVMLAPPSAARVKLTFSRSQGNDQRIEVPRGTRVTLSRSAEGEDPPIFTTASALTLEPDENSASVLAYHCQLVQGEALGSSTGLPGQSFQLRQAPVIAPTGDKLDLVIGVEAESELDERTPSVTHEGITYRIWREVEHFSRDSGDDDHLYVADRATGSITFAPAIRTTGADTGNGLSRNAEALAAVPPANQRIRAWYRCGGGPGGNVAAHTLTVLKDPIPGVRVDNEEAAVGGCEQESLDNAMQRGPQELHSLNRAITARDYEAVALREGSVGRAHAVARAERWRFAAPGTVQLLLVPGLDQTPPYNQQQLENAQTNEALARVRQAIDERRPLGTDCVIDWYHYKPVSVQARLVLHPEEDARSVEDRVENRLHEMINPLGKQPLRSRLHASDVYHAALNEPGVLYADEVQFSVDHAPESDVGAVMADPFHPDLWYAGAGDQVFRSMDDGEGWEKLVRFDEEYIDRITCCDARAGLLATISLRSDGDNTISRVRISEDCGQNWQKPHELGFQVNDLAWVQRGGEPVLLLATDEGLYQLPPGSGPVPVAVDEHNQGLAFYAVAAAEAPRVGTQVAVAARNSKGVYLCPDEQLEDFQHIGLDGQDVRVLTAQRIGPRAFLWAGVAAVGGEDGDGCLRWELRRDTTGGDGWMAMGNGWKGGSCRALATHGEHVFAATFHSGVVAMDSAVKDPEWRVPAIDCGLPLRDTDRLLQKVNDVTVAPPRGAETDRMPTVLCGGPHGAFRSRDGAHAFRNISRRTFTDHVTIGEGFLFCSGKHKVEAVHDETR